MILLDGGELIFEWAPGQCFGPPINILNEVDVDVNDINNNNTITEGNDFNDEIVDQIFEDVDCDEETSASTTNNIEINENDNVDIKEDDASEHSIDTETDDNTYRSTHDFDAYTLIQDVLEDNIPPSPRSNPSCAATGAGITKLQPSFNSQVYNTSRITTEDYENISTNNKDISITNNDIKYHNPNTNFLSTHDKKIDKMEK